MAATGASPGGHTGVPIAMRGGHTDNRIAMRAWEDPQRRAFLDQATAKYGWPRTGCARSTRVASGGVGRISSADRLCDVPVVLGNRIWA